MEISSEFAFAEKLFFDDGPKPASTSSGNKQSLINGINGGLGIKNIERKESSGRNISTDSGQPTNDGIPSYQSLYVLSFACAKESFDKLRITILRIKSQKKAHRD